MSLKKKATSGLAWTFTQQFGNQAIGFVVSLILARLLLPEEFGLIGMIAVFVAVGNTLVKSGLTQSIIRSPKIDEGDLSTVFYFNLVASLFIYLIIFFSAPLIADFYNQKILKDIIRVFCLSFILDGFSAVQLAFLTKNMNFKTHALISIPSTTVGGTIGISMALYGFGVWSLVFSTLGGSLVNTVLLWKFSNWKPQLLFNLPKFKEHFNFGYKITLAGLLDTLFKNIYIIIIGRFFSAGQVGFYTRAETMKQLPLTNLSNALNQVTYPLFSSIQDDSVRLKSAYRKVMKLMIFVITPTLITLGILAEPLFRFLFTEKWLPAVPYFQILCVSGILLPINAYNINILKVKGRSGTYLKLEFFQKLIVVLAILMAINFGIYGLLYAQIFTTIIGFLLSSHYSGRLIQYSTLEQVKDIYPAILLSIFAGTIIYLLDDIVFFSLADFVRLIFGAIIVFLVYVGSAYLLNFDSIQELKKIIFSKRPPNS